MSYWNFARSPLSVRLLLDYGRARQLAETTLLRGSGLRTAQLVDPAMTVSASQELAVVANLLRHLRDEPEPGLQVGLSYRLSDYGILGYGLLSSATGAAALALARRFLPLTYAYVGIAHRRRGEFDELAFAAPGDLPPALQRFVVTRAMGATSRLLRDVLGSGFTLAGFAIGYAAPASAPQPTPVLGAPIRYGAVAHALSFAHHQMTRPLPQANTVTASMCERQCAQLLAQRRSQLDTRSFVRDHLTALPPGQAPSLAAMAGLLNTSERSLKRRLQQEGASFRAIANAVRQGRADALLDAGRLSLTEVAAELGYADLSSFSQAYKRWRGVAPSTHAARATRPTRPPRSR